MYLAQHLGLGVKIFFRNQLGAIIQTHDFTRGADAFDLVDACCLEVLRHRRRTSKPLWLGLALRITALVHSGSSPRCHHRRRRRRRLGGVVVELAIDQRPRRLR